MWDGYDTKPPLPCALSQLMNDSEVRVITSCDTSHGLVLVSAFAQASQIMGWLHEVALHRRCL
ncbi:hypothetical protein M758_4G042300 [Ceratodon purpureus]|nr:hypothetical protein M758_4G042300 [Ceratodon purpureus]